MDGKHCLRQFSWEKTPVISYVSAWFFVMPSQLRKPYLLLVSDRHLCDSRPLWPGGGRGVGTLLMKGKVSLWDTAVEPVCVCVSLRHLHLNAYSPLTFLQLDGLKWCLASANTHTHLYTHLHRKPRRSLQTIPEKYVIILSVGNSSKFTNS